MVEPFSLTRDPFAGQTFVPPSINVLAAIPQAAPKPRRNILSAIGRVADAAAMAGGAQPLYRMEMERRQAAEQAEMERQRQEALRQQRNEAIGALTQNPKNMEAFASLLQAGDPKAIELYKTLNEPDPSQRQQGSPSGPMQMIRAAMDQGYTFEQAIDLYRQTLPGFAPQTQKLRDASGGETLYQVDRATRGGQALNPQEVFARMRQLESGGRQFGPDGRPLTSPKGAIGIAQVMPATAPEAAALAGLPFDEERYRNDPQYNEALGQAYFREQLRAFGDPAKAAAAYNAGPGRVRDAIQRGGENWLSLLPAETRNYVNSIFGASGPRAQAVASAPGRQFRPGVQHGMTGQFDQTGRFYPDPQPRAAAGTQQNRKDAGPDPEARQRLGTTLGGLAKTYQNLDRMGVAPSAERGLLPNVRNFAASTSIGQRIGRAVGTPAQRERERISSLRPAIISQLKQVTGMSAQQMNSNVELQFFLNMATDPTQDVEANLFAVDQLDRLFGPGDTLKKALTPNMYARVQRAGIGIQAPRSNITYVTSPEQASGLPPGTRFMAPDGKLRVKR